MSTQGKSPFDDASGQQLLDFLYNLGGVGSVIHDYVAAGTNLATATPTTLGTVNVTSTGVGTGVLLSNSARVGQSVIVYNADAAHSLKLYPPDAAQNIDDEAAGDPITIPVLSSRTFTRMSNTFWISSSTSP